MSSAAKELGVTHSAISHHVRTLEDILQVKLFDRSHNRIQLTADGARLLHVLTESFDRMSQTIRYMGDADDSSELRVSCPNSLAAKWLVPLLGSFLKENPMAEITVVPTNIVEECLAPEYDLSIIYGEIASRSKRVVRLIDTVFFPVCSPSFLNASRPKITDPEDLLGYTLLHADDPSDWSRWLAAVGVNDIRAAKNVYFERTHLALEAAATGYGIALGDNFLTKNDLEEGTLVRIFDSAIPAQHVHHLVTPHEEHRSSLGRRFEDWVVARIGEN